jgi:hypothetical protein
MINFLKTLAVWLVCVGIGYVSVTLTALFLSSPDDFLFWFGFLILIAISAVIGKYILTSIRNWVQLTFDKAEHEEPV